jgi:two-component system cell cycle sensor histidine kinase/response regulator CckA
MVVNLALNARDAMPEGGRLTIATSLHEGPQASSPEGYAGRLVRLTVSDSGTGMTPQVASQIFEPFFTTKPVGKGTGLGLSTCQALIAQSGGRIRVQSAPGKGATFLIELPAIDEPSVQPPREAAAWVERTALGDA